MREADDGPPVDQRFALVHRSDYEILDTWHAMGLAGTGSKDVAVKKLFVPAQYTLSAWAFNGKPHPGSAVNPSPLFRLPLLALGATFLPGSCWAARAAPMRSRWGQPASATARRPEPPVGAAQTVQIKVAEARPHRRGRARHAPQLRTRHDGRAAGEESTLDDKLRYRRDAPLPCGSASRPSIS